MKVTGIKINCRNKRFERGLRILLCLLIFSLILHSCINRRSDHVSLYVPEHGFGINVPGVIDAGTDTVKLNTGVIVKYIWKSFFKTEDNRNIFYNINSTTFPSHIIHSDSVGLVQLLFNDHEPAYFMNKQYELLERRDVSRFGYPGASFIWLNKEDNSHICNYYYMVENRLYYLSIVLPSWNNKNIKIKNRFIDSFQLINES